MDRFVATKPVRFDRNYVVGEVIPAEVINPRNVKRLIDWGKIQRVTTPLSADEAECGEQAAEITRLTAEIDRLRMENNELRDKIDNIQAAGIADDGISKPTDDGVPATSGEGNPPETPEKPDGDAGSAGDADTPSEINTEQDGAQAAATGASFICPVCGKQCATKSALTSHQKTHDTT